MGKFIRYERTREILCISKQNISVIHVKKYFIKKIFYRISRGKKKKTYATDEMIKEITIFLLEKEFTKEKYYERISNFLISCRKKFFLIFKIL